MKFLIIGDLHGNKPSIYRKDFDAIIAPGDFCSDAPRKVMFQALKERLQNPKSKVTWYDLVGKKKAKQMVLQSLKDGRAILKQLNSYGVPVYLVPGNWDWTGKTEYATSKKDAWKFLQTNHYKTLTKGLKNLKDVYHKSVNISEHIIIGHGITSGPEIPQYKEDKARLTKQQLLQGKKRYKKLHTKVASLFKKAKKPIIFLSHNVPFNTPIDKITDKRSPRVGYHYGSLLTRQLIDKYQPLVCIGGHMHEHFTSCKVGETTAINAGFGSHVNVFLEVKGNKIKELKFIKGKK